MRPTLAASAKLLSEPDAVSRTRGATIAYELCLARCVAPVTALAPAHIALGRDFILLGPVLRRLGRALRVPPTDKDTVALVIASARALAAVAALLLYAQRCDVDAEQLNKVAGPLRSRCTPALVVPLLATDLRVVGAARDALDQLVLLRAAHQSPWLDVLLAIRAFRDHYTSSAAADANPIPRGSSTGRADAQALLAVVLDRVSSLLRTQFVETAARAEARALDASVPADRVRRRTSVTSPPPPVRVSAMSSWHARPDAPPAELWRSGGRFLSKLRRVRRSRPPPTPVPADEKEIADNSDGDSFGASVNGMRLSYRGRRAADAVLEPVRRISTDSIRGRRSVDAPSIDLGRRDSVSRRDSDAAKLSRKSSVASRRKRLSISGRPGRERKPGDPVPAEWQGEPLGVLNRSISTGMHVYERLLSRGLLPSLQDRCQVIDDLHRLAQPMLTGVTAGASHVDAAALRVTVANAFLTHGARVFPALLALVFRPAPWKGERAKRQLSLELATDASNVTNPRRSRRYRTADNIMGSMHSLLGKETSPTKTDAVPEPAAICLPNPDCDTDTAMQCSALLTLLVRHVPGVCTPRLPLMTGATNSAYWHCAEALAEDASTAGRAAWQVARLVGAVDALCLLNASMPGEADDATKIVCPDAVELDAVVETCMRSVCASGCRLARVDARASAPELSDTGVVESARAWVALSKLPTQAVLWPSGPAYSSAVVFVAHLARRAGLAEYAKLRPPGTRTPVIPPPVAADPGLGDDASRPPPVRTDSDETDLTQRLQACVAVLVRGNGSAVVMHDLFRTLLYIIGCELRGAPTRRPVIGVAAHVVQTPNDPAIVGQNLHASRLPGRAPMFTRAAHSPARSASLPRRSLELPSGLVRAGSIEEHDMSGLLVGNIAVDGSRDNNLRDAAAKVDSARVARWFVGLAPPRPAPDRPGRRPASMRNPYATPEPFVRGARHIVADPIFPPTDSIPPHRARSTRPARTPPGSDREVAPKLFDELATALSVVLNCVVTSAADEGEDLNVALDAVADDVTNAKSPIVFQLHAKAVVLLNEARADRAGGELSQRALARTVRELRGELDALRMEFEEFRAEVAKNDEMKKPFWPKRQFPRPGNLNLSEVPVGSAADAA